MDQNRLEKKNDETEVNFHHDPLGRIMGGVIVIWLGVSFLLMENGYIPNGKWWAYFLLGLGIIFFLEVFVRMTRPEYEKHYFGRLIAGAVLVAIGAGNIFEMENWWPLVLIAVGFVIVYMSFKQKNET